MPKRPGICPSNRNTTPVTDPSTVAAERLRRHHRDLLAGVLEVADAVASDWSGETTTDRSAVVGPLRAGLSSTGLLDRFPTVLDDLITAIGRSPPAAIVPQPPYVAVTSVGPVLRATLDDGRLVATLRTFVVDRTEGVEYRRGPTAPDDVPEVAFR